MGKWIKSYLVFTGTGSRVVLFLLAPLATAAIQALWGILMNTGIFGNFADWGLMIGLSLAAGIMMQAEVVMDNWVFGGIALKGGVGLKYLQTSVKGRGVIRNALRCDMLRMLAECAAALCLGAAAGALAGGDFKELLRTGNGTKIVFLVIMILDEYVAAAGIKLITRHFGSLHFNTGMAGLGCLALFSVAALAVLTPYFVLAVLVGEAVLISVLGLRKIMNRVEESYYDR